MQTKELKMTVKEATSICVRGAVVVPGGCGLAGAELSIRLSSSES